MKNIQSWKLSLALRGQFSFYDQVVKNNDELFIHDDLWTSFFLFYVKKVKILSLQSHLKKNDSGKFSLIYKKHCHDDGLISGYALNINEAVKKRDQIALKSLEYMFDKISSFKF